jgi:hypothetical protein
MTPSICDKTLAENAGQTPCQMRNAPQGRENDRDSEFDMEREPTIELLGPAENAGCSVIA